MAKMTWRLAGILILGACSLGVWAQTRSEDALPSRYRKWLDEEVVYIIKDVEKNVFFRLKTDQERDSFIASFWKERDPDPGTAVNESKEEHYRRLAYANEHFSTAGTPGWRTELGRLYIVMGETWPSPRPGDAPTVKLRLYEGIKDRTSPVPQPVTSSYLQSTISASIESEADIAQERSRLVSVFNLKDVRLLTEAAIQWPKRREDDQISLIVHMLNLDGLPYLFTLSPVGELGKRQFHIAILQNQPVGVEKSVLDTEIVLPRQNTAIFGFQNAKGQPYFLSLSIPSLAESGAKIAPESGKNPNPSASKETRIEFEKGAVRCSELVPPPRLIKSVDAVYPEIARQAKIEGVVGLDIRADTAGRVKKIRVLRSIPLLDQSAINAARQWVFEPVIIDGAAVEAIFAVDIGFSLKSPGGRMSTGWESPGDNIITGAVKVEGEMAPPKCLKSVSPVYPEIAKQAKIEGLVVLGVRTDEKGRVEAVNVIRSMPLLDQAAIDAVRQWIYEPLVIKGQPRKAVFTVSIGFWLDKLS
jgi:TonB family protein